MPIVGNDQNSSEIIRQKILEPKHGINIEAVLEQIVNLLPPPVGDDEGPLKALIFDSYYDNFKGVICFVRIKEGTVKVGTKIRTFMSDKTFDVTEVGVFSPGLTPRDKLVAGDVGFYPNARSCKCKCNVIREINDLFN